MNEYTPTTEQVRRDYARAGYPLDADYRSVGRAEFDRWLRGVLADAWDEGAGAGYDDAEAGREEKHNPYREENL